MASVKQYGYQIRGKQISILEKDFDGDADGLNYTYDASEGIQFRGGGGVWKSPISSVTDGLEIEYVYSPKYSVATEATINANKFYINGWTVIDVYLTFLRSHLTSNVDWTASPYSAVTSGSAGHTGGQASDYIVVQGSSRWNGLHRVQTAGTYGTLKTYTKVSQEVPNVIGNSNINMNPENLETLKEKNTLRLW